MVQAVQFSVADYARMRETGIFDEDDRVELLDGAIYHMIPVGPLHIALVNRLTRLLIEQAGDAAIVSVQNAIQLDDYSEPQPDFALLRVRADDYSQELARSEDVLVVIEVADSSLAFDRDQKLPRYAQAGIPEVWIVDVGQQIVEQYLQPLQGVYTQQFNCLKGIEIECRMLPSIRFSTDRIFRE